MRGVIAADDRGHAAREQHPRGAEGAHAITPHHFGCGVRGVVQLRKLLGARIRAVGALTPDEQGFNDAIQALSRAPWGSRLASWRRASVGGAIGSHDCWLCGCPGRCACVVHVVGAGQTPGA